MAQQSSIFPIYLRAEYKEGGQGFQRFQSDAMRAAQAASGQIKKVGAALDGIFSARRTSGGSLDLGVDGLKSAIDAQRQLAIASREVADAATRAAQANGGVDASYRITATAAREYAKAQEAELASLTQKLPILQQVQAELSNAASEASALTGENLRLAQAEAGAANGAAMLAATLRGTALEQDRTANSARESARVFEQMFAQQEADARAAAAAQRELTAAAASLRGELDPMFGAQQRFDRELARADQLLQDGVISSREYADAQALARENLRAAAEAAMASAKATDAVAEAEYRAAEATAATGLARKRNQGGSLDIDIKGLEQELAAQRARATAAREVADATARLATTEAGANGALAERIRGARQYQQEMEKQTRELEEYIRVEQLIQQELNKTASATNQVVQAQARGTTARGNVINSVRAERTAFVQLGQQLQDITIQAQAGTSGFTIFAQQVPQAAFALSGLADSSDETLAKVGEFAGFLSGPWGAALFAATAVLGPFIYNLLDSGEAAEEAERAQRSLSEVLADTTSSYGEVIDAIRAYRAEQRKAAQSDLETLQRQIQVIGSNLRLALSIREKLKAELELQSAQARSGPTGPNGQGQLANAIVATQIGGALERNQKEMQDLVEGARLKQIEIANTLARLDTDAAARLKEGFKILRSQAEREIKDPTALRARLGDLLRQEARALDRLKESERGGRPDRSRPDRSAERETEKLNSLAESAAEQVQRINERFDDQPRLIDQAAQASRQLNQIVADINEEMATAKNLTQAQREEFEKIKDAAADAQYTIKDALLRPFEDLRRESEQRLQIQALIAQGRDDEAVALQELFRLEQILGTEADQRLKIERLIADGKTKEATEATLLLVNMAALKDEAAYRVIAERQVTRELDAQRELLELQADVARTVADDLRSILSGRSTDFFKNFKQALLDLQGARLFEDLFGPAFRQLEEELRGNTPQGRANARYTAEVNKTADTTARVETALESLAGAVEDTAARLRGDPVAANDNGSNILVTANRPDKETEIARKSVIDIAKEIGEATGMQFASVFKDVLGPRALQTLGQTIGGFIAGKALGGTTGGIIGALEGLTKNIKGLEGVSAKLGEALKGAATGTQVSAISKALGLGGSETGAQIGGALGSLGTAITGIPGLDIVGSIIGNFVGSIVSGVKRGSATIGGVGGSLGITGTVGNSKALQGTANTLAGGVLESINDIARQLGATVDASRGSVSIGQRKDSLRVDPSGRGATKIGNGAIDFGQDSEAAIAFAVKNLIEDGVITGLKASENRLLQAGKDISSALQDVLTFRGVFRQLKEIKDPVGAAIDALNTEFNGLIDLFNRAGASAEEFAQLEELYGIRRAEAIKDASDRVVGSLRSLLDELKIGGSGLSLRDRQANALTQFNSLASRVAAGDKTAFDDFADVSKQLLDIERQLFGSTQSYFDRLFQVTALTERAIADQTNVTSIAAASPSPFADTPAIDRSIDTMNSNLGAKLDQLNANFIAVGNLLGRAVAPPGGSGNPEFGGGFDRVANF